VTLLDLVDEVYERTHLAKLEILDIARRNWPGLADFKPTQAALLVHLIQRKNGKDTNGAAGVR